MKAGQRLQYNQGQKQEQKQEQRLTQQQQFSLHVLQMNQEEFKEYLEKEAQENPLVEFDREYFVRKSGTGVCDFDQILNHAGKRRTLTEVLLEQAGCNKNVKRMDIMEYLIHSLDLNGYLTVDTGAMQKEFPDCTEEEIEDYLYILQSFEPSGVGARSLEECLEIQLSEQFSPYRKCAMEIVGNYMELLAENKIPVIGKKSGYSIDEINHAIELIRRLNPKPGGNYQAPAGLRDCDLQVEIEDGICRIILLGDCDAIQFHMEYEELDNPEVKAFIKPYQERIQMLSQSITARKETLVKIMTQIVENQKEYFFEKKQLKPMTLQMVADQLGINESTVSRAVSNKALIYENRIYPMKHFFVSQTKSGQSSHGVLDALKKLLDEEDKKKPLSDQKLTDRLGEKGYEVSRRTVAKYREILGIASASQRKIFE